MSTYLAPGLSGRAMHFLSGLKGLERTLTKNKINKYKKIKTKNLTNL